MSLYAAWVQVHLQMKAGSMYIVTSLIKWLAWLSSMQQHCLLALALWRSITARWLQA
jgi:hypothetical protein